MPRAIWSGAVSFGLVNIPIKLFNAVSRKSVHFNQIDSRTGSRIQYKKVSAADGEEVPSEAITKGYQLSSGEYVLIGDDELASLDPESSRTIEIEQFVDLSEIDPVFYDAAYYVAPDKAARKPYALLVKAMEEEGKVAIARFVMRTKQYLAALRPKDGVLLLSTMVYADEVNDPREVGEIDGVADTEVSDRELRMAAQLIESLSEPFQADDFQDTYRHQVLELVERKAAGEEELVPAPAPQAEERVVDLMAALEASVKEAKAARGRHPANKATSKASSDEGDGEGEGDAEEAPAKAKAARATKAAKRKSA